MLPESPKNLVKTLDINQKNFWERHPNWVTFGLFLLALVPIIGTIPAWFLWRKLRRNIYNKSNEAILQNIITDNDKGIYSDSEYTSSRMPSDTIKTKCAEHRFFFSLGTIRLLHQYINVIGESRGSLGGGGGWQVNILDLDECLCSCLARLDTVLLADQKKRIIRDTSKILLTYFGQHVFTYAGDYASHTGYNTEERCFCDYCKIFTMFTFALVTQKYVENYQPLVSCAEYQLIFRLQPIRGSSNLAGPIPTGSDEVKIESFLINEKPFPHAKAFPNAKTAVKSYYDAHYSGTPGPSH